MEKSIEKKENSKKFLFEKMKVSKAIATLAIPTIISQLINLVYSLVDTIFIGRVGNPYMVSAITVVFTVYMMTISFSNLFGVGGGSLIARLIGRGEEQEAKKVSAYSLYMAGFVAILYSLLVFIFLNPILRLLGASSDTIEYAKEYLWIVCIIGDLPVILSITLAHILRNCGYARQASFGLSMGGVLNIAFDPLFMFVLLPKGSEVIGAALATLIANVIACIYLLIVIIRVSKTSPLSIRFKDALNIRKKDIKELFTVGIPSAILTTMFDIGNIFVNKLASGHGDLELAAMGIVMKAERLPNAINIGLCQGTLPLIAYNYASGNNERRMKIINTSRIYGLSIAAVGIIIYTILAKDICKVFLSTTTGNVEDSLKVIEYASIYLAIRCFCSPFQFINFSTSYILQAVGDGRDTLIHACIRIMVIYIPSMFVLNYLFGMEGLVSAAIFSEAISCVIALVLLHLFQKKHILNVKKEEVENNEDI